MRINVKKSCLRIDPRFNATCTGITTTDGHSLRLWPSVVVLVFPGSAVKYGRHRCLSPNPMQNAFSIDQLDTIFGKVGRLASEEVIFY